MSLYVTGDTHGDVISRFSFKRKPILRNLTKDDIVIILGDFGIPWNHLTQEHDVYAAKWLDEKPWTTIALRGNHDNTDLLREMPREKQFGGEVRRLQVGDYTANHIFVVDVPTILTLENQKCLCIPGAQSHDIGECARGYKGKTILNPADPYAKITKKYFKTHNIFYRTLGESWWEDEDIDIDKVTKILMSPYADTSHFDFIFSHDYPAIINTEYKPLGFPARLKSTEGEKHLENIRQHREFDAWFHGHLHVDVEQWISDPRIIGMYQSILQIS